MNITLDMYVCKGWAIKTGPHTVTFNHLLCYIHWTWSSAWWGIFNTYSILGTETISVIS
jgi:hypothetical protein